MSSTSLEMFWFGVLFLNFLLAISSLGKTQSNCDAQQRLEIGKTGTIKCSFQDGFYTVAWYTPESFLKQTPLVRLVDGVKIGMGLSTGEYDIRPDGSLIINNVTLLHDTNFTALTFQSEGDDPIYVTVEVAVIVKPISAIPVVDICLNETTCYARLEHGSEVSCHVANSRPAINLNWVGRTPGGDLNVSSQRSIVTTDGFLFTSRAATNHIFEYSLFLSLLVCKADGFPGRMLEDESAIFIENSKNDLSVMKPVVKYVQKHSAFTLTCSKRNISLIVWKKADLHGDDFRILSYAAFFENGFSKTSSNNYILQSDGSLLIPQIKTNDEGLYGCIYDNYTTGDASLFDVIVYVQAPPVIQGCPLHQHCVLDGQRTGNLTCFVKGIRPTVILEWKTFFDEESSFISFTNHQLTTTSNGDTYDITLSSKYQLEDTSTTRITIECVTSQFNAEVMKSSAKFDLRFSYVQPTGQPTPPFGRRLLWILMIIIPLCLLVIFFCLLYILRGRRRKRRGMKKKFYQEEDIPMISTVMTQLDPESDLKSVFKRELKTKYKYQYDAVQPIPYIRDRLYCVDRVFVEGGFEKQISKDKIEGLGNWETLTSYHEVTTMSSSSTRTIIEGDPGYGKSTLTLQLAYDWCNCTVTSPLADVDILILLRLRQLGGVYSVFRAIKQFILPRDSLLSETDIENILRGSRSTVVILDGFDECPEEETENLTDFISIIRGEMFQENVVILTTRSFFLPKSYPPQTRRIRLKGFDGKARDAYIRKAVVGDNTKAAEKIKRSLQKNPVLQGLCQVPLFFVMFAHMTHESDQFMKFRSVTSFFRYMIACFHSHMKNKMLDINVKKLDLNENDHARLDKVAFEGLSGKNQKIVWRKEDLLQRLGNEFYNQYKRIGILVEEEVLDITERHGDIQYKTEVRFYHKLFCEWYAAHYLCREVVKPETNLHQILEYMNPFDLQYTYRFACGLDSKAGNKIIEYLRGIKDGDKFAMLCILEQSGNLDQIKDTIQELCSNYITIDHTDSLLLQGSIVQLLEIGSSNKIPISFVWLNGCFNSVDLSAGSILLKSELSIPALSTLKEVVIGERGREFTKEEFWDVLEYSMMCSDLKIIRFCYVLMPQSITKKQCSVLESRNLQVMWCTDDFDYLLSLQSGKWAAYDPRSSKNVFEGSVFARKNLLISLMKEKYKEVTSAVQAIPSDHDTLYHVDQIYVNSGLQCMIANDKEKSSRQWEPMDSYQNIFTDRRVKSKRHVLEGKSGFGKSMVALRMAYDWCNNNPKSPLSTVDLFLLVRLELGKISKSIYTDIKRCVLPRDSPLSYIDIKSVLRDCSSAVMVLDGFDLYTYEQTDDTSDVIQIIRGKSLKDIDVITTGTCVPKEFLPGTNRLRLTGFDDKARDEYIQRVMASNDIVTADNIKQQLSENSVLVDLFKVPWFFALFTHMVKKRDDLSTFQCQFSLFTACLRSHMKNQAYEYDEKETKSFERNLPKFHKVAFECLCRNDQRLMLDKDELCKKIGKECYDKLIRFGVLLEVETVTDGDNGKSTSNQHCREVTFYHELFCEWNAAHYVAKHATGQHSEKIKSWLRGLSTSTAQHLCSFACELDTDAASSIIRLAKSRDDYNEFAKIIIYNSNMQASGIFDIVQEFCSSQLSFNNDQEELLQKSIIHLLQIASKDQISISWVYLNNCYSTVYLSGGNHLQLKSNLSIPVLTTLNKLEIQEDGREITGEEFTDILQYSSKCLALKELRFNACLLPQSAQAESVSVLRSRNVKVSWISTNYFHYQFNLQSCLWERTDGYNGPVIGVMTDNDYRIEVIKLRDAYVEYEESLKYEESLEFLEYEEYEEYEEDCADYTTQQQTDRLFP